MYGFFRRPKWIVLTVLVALATVAMVWAGFWQLRRLDERQARNDLVRERSAAETEPVDAVLPLDLSLDEARSTAEWRRVEAEGTYDPDGEVLIRNRSLDGAPGYHVVTPLVLADGSALLVNRGWIPLPGSADEDPTAPAPTPGTVTIVGRVRGTQERGAIGPTDPDEGVLDMLARVDVARIAQQLTSPVRPAYVELETQVPALSQPLPRLLPTPELDDGPHLAYAVQWFTFSLLAVGGWILVVRREVQQQRKASAAAGGAGDGDGDGESAQLTPR